MFPHMIETRVAIAATPEAVIARLVDCENISTWSTFTKKMEVTSGEKEVIAGCSLLVDLDAKGDGKTITFKPKVLVKSERELRWVGTLGLESLFRGEHFFVASSGCNDEGCTLTHGECFTGLLCPLFAKLGVFNDTEAAFKRQNEELAISFA
jgi:hypothetical protein